MKLKLLTATAALALVSASSAHAVLVAGWDFSNLLGDGLNSNDGVSFTNTLSANYSSFDATFNAGAESAAFGTLYYNGQFGSTNVDAGNTDEITPTAGSLASNINDGSPTFERYTVLESEGQPFANDLSMTNAGAVSLVFAVDAGTLMQDWSVSFAAQTFAGVGNIDISYSINGSSYAFIETVNVTNLDTRYEVQLAAGAGEVAFVRFDFDAPAGGGVGQIKLDQVAVNGTSAIPEPASFAALAGLAGLGLAASRRRRRA